MLDDEAAETTEIHRLALGEGTLDALHESFDYSLNCDFFNTGSFCYFVNDLCLCHNWFIFKVFDFS